jgi:hypothetical protein
MADQLTMEWTKLDNRARFIGEIIDGKLNVRNVRRDALVQELRKRGYKPFPKKPVQAADAEEEEEDNEEILAGDYDYLLSMPLWSLTVEKVCNLIIVTDCSTIVRKFETRKRWETNRIGCIIGEVRQTAVDGGFRRFHGRIRRKIRLVVIYVQLFNLGFLIKWDLFSFCRALKPTWSKRKVFNLLANQRKLKRNQSLAKN